MRLTIVILLKLCIIFFFSPMLEKAAYGKPLQTSVVDIDIGSRRNNPIHMLVVFTRFRDEAETDSLAPWWAENLFNGKKGSIDYYFEETSHDQIQVSGEYLPVRYELPHAENYYVGNISKYSWDVVKLLEKDPSVDFSKYDNDGPDGIPASGDDDGYVDYVVFMPRTRPYDFILNNATALAHLSLPGTYTTNNADVNGNFIKIDSLSGCIGTAINLHQATGTICHEYTHTFGAYDLYDTTYDSNEEDSAGIGNWGVMGRGLLGWNAGDGPTAPSAFTRLILGTIGINNENLIDIYGVHRSIRMKDSSLRDGVVYRVWIGKNEYFLISHRTNRNIYADRNTPQNGLLIWHVYDIYQSNNDEHLKVVDLECADGRYSDAGYPLGKNPDPLNGYDNLDLWSHETAFNNTFGGNLGDATDVFDGITFTRFGENTNPSSHSKIDGEPSGIEIFHIHPDGDEMVFDINSPPVTEWHNEIFPQIGMAFHRFNIPVSYNGSDKHTPTMYILKQIPDKTGASELTMVTLGKDEVSIDDITELDEYNRQRAIEARIFQNPETIKSAKVIRKNIDYETYINELSAIKRSVEALTPEKTPAWIQKITLETDSEILPEAIDLGQNFPNPFNSQTHISFTLPSSGAVTFEVYNVLGQRVRTMNLGFLATGMHTIVFDAGELASGIYFYRLAGTVVSKSRKLILLR